MRRVITVLVLATVTCALMAGAASVTWAGGGAHCAPGFTDAETDEVRLANNCFVPTIARVEQGAEVRFVNQDGAPHTVTGAVYVFGDMDEFSTGERSFTFEEEGVFPYLCILHPGMAGAIVVGDGKGKGKVTTSSVSGGSFTQDEAATEEEEAAAPAAAQPETRPTAAGTNSNLWLFVAIVLAMAGSMWWLRKKPGTET